MHVHVLSLHADASPSAVASFNDTRCTDGGVCLTDPLFFTCELKEVVILNIVLPSGEHESVSLGDTVNNIPLPAGFEAVSLNISKLDNDKRNIVVTLSIANASLLDGGEIECEDTIEQNVRAGCRLLKGKLQQRIEEKRNGDTILYIPAWLGL